MSENELESPPDHEVIWLAGRLGESKTCAVLGQTWVIARAKAAAALGCEPGHVEIERMSDEH